MLALSDSERSEQTGSTWRTRIFNDKREVCFICEKRDDGGDAQQRNAQDEIDVDVTTAVEDVVVDGESGDESARSNTANKIRKCGFPCCNLRFHENCFLNFTEGDFLPLMHILDRVADPCIDLEDSKKWMCPQHECNFCHQELLRTRAFQGEFIKCVMCVFAWHRSCVIVGSYHLNREVDKYVLCPRHNTLKRVSKRTVPYCIKCENPFESQDDKVACSLCIRSFCHSCVSYKKVGKEKDSNSAFICDFCRCFDFPRIGDYVLAAYKSNFWPARALHSDLLPVSLYSKQNFLEKLTKPGHVLVEWLEGLQIPNYDVVTCRDIIPIPKTLKSCFWKRMKRHPNVYNAVKIMYNDPEAAIGIKRPLPPEVKLEVVPKYTRVKGNINMRLARVRSDIGELEQCNCVPIDGKRCTVAHGCLNRLMMTECPEDCDKKYFERRSMQSGTKRQTLKKSGKSAGSEDLPPEKMCKNNFLRHHNVDDDSLLMEEKPTENKGFGVFAKCDIDKGTDLTEYMGRVMTKKEYFEKLQFYCSFNNLEMSYFGMRLTNDFYVDARNCGSIARSFNHSCEPNCKVDAVAVDGVYRLKVSTIKAIKKGDELTYDYDTEISDGLVGMECLCGSTNCRRVIGKKATTVRKCQTSKHRVRRKKQRNEEVVSTDRPAASMADAGESCKSCKETKPVPVQRRSKRKRTRSAETNRDEEIENIDEALNNVCLKNFIIRLTKVMVDPHSDAGISINSDGFKDALNFLLMVDALQIAREKHQSKNCATLS